MENNSFLIFLLLEYLKSRLRLTEYILKAFSMICSLSLPCRQKKSESLRISTRSFSNVGIGVPDTSCNGPLKQGSLRRQSCCPYPNSDILYLYRGAKNSRLSPLRKSKMVSAEFLSVSTKIMRLDERSCCRSEVISPWQIQNLANGRLVCNRLDTSIMSSAGLGENIGFFTLAYIPWLVLISTLLFTSLNKCQSKEELLMFILLLRSSNKSSILKS